MGVVQNIKLAVESTKTCQERNRSYVAVDCCVNAGASMYKRSEIAKDVMVTPRKRVLFLHVLLFYC